MKIEQNALEIEEPKFTQCGEFKIQTTLNKKYSKTHNYDLPQTY